MMGLEESVLFEQIKTELKMLTARRNRDAVRSGVLRQARLMLGTGVSASEVSRLIAAKPGGKRSLQPQQSDT